MQKSLSQDIRDLVANPRETLQVEAKRWLDLDDPSDQAKFIKAVFALRNYNGGYLIIGLDNDTMKPHSEGQPDDIGASYHHDVVQALIMRFASRPFEVEANFADHDEQPLVVIKIPSGVRTPVAIRRDLESERKFLLRKNDVFTRTLFANHTPSSARAQWSDWEKLMDICFENREADIGRFLRRHLAGADIPALLEELSANFAGMEVGDRKSVPEQVEALMDVGRARLDTVTQKVGQEIPGKGAWEVGFKIIGEVPKHRANHDFLNKLAKSNPGLTGWPIWLDARQSGYTEDHPKTHKGVFESLIAAIQRGWSNHFDFMRLNPAGEFYLYRVLQDDLDASRDAPEPGTQLDYGIPVVRVAETLAVGKAFALGMGCDPDTTNLAFGFRWTGLQERLLSAWGQTHPESTVFFPLKPIAQQMQAESFVSVPANVANSALGAFVAEAVEPLHEAFAGFSLGQPQIDDFTARTLERRW